MANAVNTGSTLTLPNGVNKTSTAISTNIIILVNNTPVGAVQELRIDESRKIQMINEVGTDGHIDSVPVSSTDVSGNCKRVRFDRLRGAEAFSRGFSHISSQIYPFDIIILDKQKADQASQISTIIKNVWFNKISYSYSADNWIITDDLGWEAETIFSVLNNGNTPIAQGGELGITHATINAGSVSNIEQMVDSGNSARRGSLDSGGLIDLALSTDNLF